MKKLKLMAVVFLCFLFIMALKIDSVSTQSAKNVIRVTEPIPADVMNITDKSCVMCHAIPGKGFALANLNLSKWDKYSLAKQAKKAKKMCKMITQGRMPPKKIRNKYPDSVPTKAEIKIICDWSKSLRADN